MEKGGDTLHTLHINPEIDIRNPSVEKKIGFK